jgi:hypothetical protein
LCLASKAFGSVLRTLVSVSPGPRVWCEQSIREYARKLASPRARGCFQSAGRIPSSSYRPVAFPIGPRAWQDRRGRNPTERKLATVLAGRGSLAGHLEGLPSRVRPLGPSGPCARGSGRCFVHLEWVRPLTGRRRAVCQTLWQSGCVPCCVASGSSQALCLLVPGDLRPKSGEACFPGCEPGLRSASPAVTPRRSRLRASEESCFLRDARTLVLCPVRLDPDVPSGMSGDFRTGDPGQPESDLRHVDSGEVRAATSPFPAAGLAICQRVQSSKARFLAGPPVSSSGSESLGMIFHDAEPTARDLRIAGMSVGQPNGRRPRKGRLRAAEGSTRRTPGAAVGWNKPTWLWKEQAPESVRNAERGTYRDLGTPGWWTSRALYAGGDKTLRKPVASARQT